MRLSSRSMGPALLVAAIAMGGAPQSSAQQSPPPGMPGMMSSGGSCQKLPVGSSPMAPHTGPIAFADAVQGLTPTDGLFPLYQNMENGDLYMEIRAPQLRDDRSFIYHAQVLHAPIIAGLIPNFYLASKLVTFSRHFQRIEIIQENTNYYVDPDSALSRNVENGISNALLVSTKIVAAEGEGDDARFLICANEVFQSESLVSVTPYREPPGSPPSPGGAGYAVGNVDAGKSKIVGHAGYPQNTDIRVEYVFSHPDSKRFREDGGRPIADSRKVSIRVQHSLIEVPEDTGYEPRRADFRVGYLGPTRDDLSSTSPTAYNDLIIRWNLEKRDADADISEPVEPIVWWISNSTPVQYRDEVERGVLAWNEAFERIGFRDALVVRQQPDEAEWDAGDLRYNTLYFASNPAAFFYGYGPSISDPRTGQIIGADIAIEFSMIVSGQNNARLYGDDDVDRLTDLPGAWSQWRDRHAHCFLGAFMSNQATLARSILKSRGVSDVVRQRVIDQFVTAVVVHEVGHTLGLTHNMKASSSVALETLMEPDGLVSGSIMDYLPGNYLPSDGERQVYHQTTPGPYDLWAIEYGYHPALEDPESEAQRMRELLARSSEPALIFGNDAEVVQYNVGVDPRTLVGDLSNDLVGWAELHTRTIGDAIAGLQASHTQDDEAFQDLRSSLEALLLERRQITATLAMVVGGTWMETGTAEQLQEAGTVPFTPVSGRDQRRALQLIEELIYAPDAYDLLSESLLSSAQNQRRSFDFANDRRGEPLSLPEIASADQAFTNLYLLSALRLRRLTANEAIGGDFTVHDLLSHLDDAIFGGSCFAQPNVYQRIAQASYFEKLLDIVANSTYDGNAQAAAERSLSVISGRIYGICNLAVGVEVAAHRLRLRQMLADR